MHSQTQDEQMPSTPTGPSRAYNKQTASMRALKTDQLKQDTSFFDDATPIDRSRGSEPHRDPLRDSHDLSFADGANVRDSVVDNMLLSLDQFSTGHMFSNNSGSNYTQYADDDFFLQDNSYRQPGSRHRGHTYTSSHSSDYDLRPEDHSRNIADVPRSRRSNSSNNISLPMSRKGSARDALGSRQANIPYGQFHQSGHARGNGKKSSMGSGSSSMDFGQAGVLGNQRLGFGKRSASFDQSNCDRPRGQPLKVESVLDRGRVAYMNYPEDYDAAPEPTIPAGPRRIQEPSQSPVAYPPQPQYAPPQTPGSRRRGSVRSNTSYKTLRKNKSQPAETNMRAQAQEFVNASTLRDTAPVPSLQDPAAPSPSVATRKGLFPSQGSAATPKERPGFFRRVFGGSSKSQTPLSNPASTIASPQTEQPPASSKPLPDIDSIYSPARPRTTPSNENNPQSRSSAKSQTAVPLPQKEAQPPLPPSLVKKPSSFFRRRKKSISDNGRPPVMALDFTPPSKPVLPAQPSPSVNSLRKAMNPYLAETPRGGEHFYESRENQPLEDVVKKERTQGFSPGYKPHKDALVRTVQTSSQEDDSTPPSSRGDQVATHLPTSDSQKMRLKAKHGKSAARSQQEDTFLADSSSCNEDRSGRASPTGDRSGTDDVRRPSTGPASSSVNHSSLQSGSDDKPNGGRPKDLLLPTPPNNKPKPVSRSGGASQSASEVEDEGWVLTQPPKQEHASQRGSSPSAKRVWLDTTMADDNANDLKLPIEGTRESPLLEKPSPTSPHALSPNEVFHSATSLPIVQVESRESDSMPDAVQTRATHSEPTDADRERALQIFSGDDSVALKAQAAAMLGDVTLSSTRIRKALMDLFNWTGFTILAAMRDLCGKLVLKAETQQVDRILMSLSERWCECNPNHGFKAVGKYS